ncbi:MAG: hypothetical protein EPO21_10460 [Chloroflexota bacterium]|nr:MAG: hypothetical protein EPO21_10460 [Chloroflexota bacterium]
MADESSMLVTLIALVDFVPTIHGIADVRAVNASVDAWLHSPNDEEDGRPEVKGKVRQRENSD